MENELIADFIAARESLFRWRAATRKALLVVGAHFPRSHPLRRSVEIVCTSLGEYRYQADVAACRHADSVGDQVFNRTIDGVLLHGPTDWFYGASLRVVDDPDVKISKHVPQAKSLDIIEISVIHMLWQHARGFVEGVNRLPTGARISSEAGRRLAKSEKEMVRNYQRMVTQLEKTLVNHSETYKVILCLNRWGLNTDVCRCVIGFVAQTPPGLI